eukprot:364849-Chlamydomonas_euryale.AAC.5
MHAMRRAAPQLWRGGRPHRLCPAAVTANAGMCLQPHAACSANASTQRSHPTAVGSRALSWTMLAHEHTRASATRYGWYVPKGGTVR